MLERRIHPLVWTELNKNPGNAILWFRYVYRFAGRLDGGNPLPERFPPIGNPPPIKDSRGAIHKGSLSRDVSSWLFWGKSGCRNRLIIVHVDCDLLFAYRRCSFLAFLDNHLETEDRSRIIFDDFYSLLRTNSLSSITTQLFRQTLVAFTLSRMCGTACKQPYKWKSRGSRAARKQYLLLCSNYRKRGACPGSFFEFGSWVGCHPLGSGDG